jgi:chaperonin GroES
MIKPLEDRVLIKPIEEKEKVSASGLIIASVSKEIPTEGHVVAVGPGITFANGTKLIMDLAIGDKVVYSKYSGTEVDHEGEAYILIPYKDIFVVIEDEDN